MEEGNGFLPDEGECEADLDGAGVTAVKDRWSKENPAGDVCRGETAQGASRRCWSAMGDLAEGGECGSGAAISADEEALGMGGAWQRRPSTWLAHLGAAEGSKAAGDDRRATSLG